MSRMLFPAVVAIEAVLVVGAFNPAPHTGGDNALYVSLAHALLTTGSYVELFDPAGLPHTKYPPVFPALLAALIALGGRTWVALKSTAAVSTVAAVAFTYLWAARRVGPWAAFAVALLLGASSAVVYYSHWVLSDPLFLALTMASLWAMEGSGGSASPVVREGAATPDAAGPGRPLFLAVGVAAAGLAYLTRSAGLPLVVAIGVWLVASKRWRALAASALAIGVPAVWWWVRGLGAAGSYSTEFWMVDPYQPALGTIGIAALVPRAVTNLGGYVLTHGPGGIVGTRGGWVSLLGVALTLAALYGWMRSARRRVGPSEIFFPLYGGLILLWPVVWAGDRFALPLYPFLFFYAAVALAGLRARVPLLVGQLATALVLLATLAPAAASWVRESGTARACARIVSSEGPWACYGPRVGAFVAAAEWAATGLPEGAAVMTRKPGIFYLSSGVPSRTFPFVPEPDAQLALADSMGARYVLLDEWDGIAGAYVGGAVTRRPGAFCYVQGFGAPGEGGAQLLGILPPDARAHAEPTRAEEVRIGLCPAGYSVAPASTPQPSSSAPTRVPLLDALAP
ncbi:MAG: hypothetical protein WEB90_06720 [Gemmatimonadota bacterium]